MPPSRENILEQTLEMILAAHSDQTQCLTCRREIRLVLSRGATGGE